jgi:peptide methionine sulfoxide reductase MsrA
MIPFVLYTKLGYMISLRKGKNPMYCGVTRSNVKVTVTINIIFDNRVVSVR